MLKLEDVYHHSGDKSSRSFFEGSGILKGGFLIECKIKEKKDTKIEIFGLCLLSSDLSAHPHEISVTLEEKVYEEQEDVNRKTYDILNAQCSCKPGSNKCKHISAMLLKLERTAETELEFFSQTELAQQWGKNSALSDGAKNLYNPIPLKQFPCVIEKMSKASSSNISGDDLNVSENSEVREVSIENFKKVDNLRELSEEEVKEAYEILISGISQVNSL